MNLVSAAVEEKVFDGLWALHQCHSNCASRVLMKYVFPVSLAETSSVDQAPVVVRTTGFWTASGGGPVPAAGSAQLVLGQAQVEPGASGQPAQAARPGLRLQRSRRRTRHHRRRRRRIHRWCQSPVSSPSLFPFYICSTMSPSISVRFYIVNQSSILSSYTWPENCLEFRISIHWLYFTLLEVFWKKYHLLPLYRYLWDST